MGEETTFCERGLRKRLCRKNLPTGILGSRSTFFRIREGAY